MGSRRLRGLRSGGGLGSTAADNAGRDARRGQTFEKTSIHHEHTSQRPNLAVARCFCTERAKASRRTLRRGSPPLFRSSPRIRSAPLVELLAAICRMRLMRSGVSLGSLRASACDRCRQKSRNPARCHFTMVSGFISRRAEPRPPRCLNRLSEQDLFFPENWLILRRTRTVANTAGGTEGGTAGSRPGGAAGTAGDGSAGKAGSGDAGGSAGSSN